MMEWIKFLMNKLSSDIHVFWRPSRKSSWRLKYTGYCNRPRSFHTLNLSFAHQKAADHGLQSFNEFLKSYSLIIHRKLSKSYRSCHGTCTIHTHSRCAVTSLRPWGARRQRVPERESMLRKRPSSIFGPLLAHGHHQQHQRRTDFRIEDNNIASELRLQPCNMLHHPPPQNILNGILLHKLKQW